jgi:hypothetical protein
MRMWWYPGTVRRLLALCVPAALAVTLLPTSQAGAAPSCSITGTAQHVRAQVVTVALSPGCPATGTKTGNLRYTQYPGTSVLGSFKLNYGTKRLALTLPRAVALNGGYTAMHTDPQTVIKLTALPKRQEFGAGKVTINGGFRASNGARVTWTQTVSVSSTHIQVGGIRVSATFPGTRSMVIQVRMPKSYCSQEACPSAATDRTDSFAFPKTYTHATATSTAYFQDGGGFLSIREAPTILLRDRLSGKVLGRSDFLAIIRAS